MIDKTEHNPPQRSYAKRMSEWEDSSLSTIHDGLSLMRRMQECIMWQEGYIKSTQEDATQYEQGLMRELNKVREYRDAAINLLANLALACKLALPDSTSFSHGQTSLSYHDCKLIWKELDVAVKFLEAEDEKPNTPGSQKQKQSKDE